MTEINNKHSHGFFSNAFGVAKKISTTGIDVLSQIAPERVTQILHPTSQGQVFEGTAQYQGALATKKCDNPQQLLREHLPTMSRQLLGRQYNTVNRVASLVSPQFSDKISDYFFDHLNQFTSNLSSVDTVLDQAGARDLEELTQDIDRSKRISQALAEQNKWLASIQGAFTGATGVIGSAVDVPLSIVMSLRMIYQVGRAYGFELNKETEQDIVQFVFKQIDLGSIAEKQSVLMALKAFSNMLQNRDISQFQQLLGSSNDAEALKKWLTNQNGEIKWEWLNHISKVSLVSKLTPLAGASIGAAYSWKLIEDVNQKAQQIFSHARSYLQQHQGVNLSPVAAYEKSLELLAQATPKLLNQQAKAEISSNELKLDQEVEIEDHQTISKVIIKKKTDQPAINDTEKDQQVQQGLEQLAEKMVESHDQVEPQKPAIRTEESIVDEYVQAEEEVEPHKIESPSTEPVAQTEAAPVKKRVTKKKV